MDKLMQIYEMLERELEEFTKRELTSSSLGTIQKITHSMKSLAAIMEMDPTGSSQRSGRGYSNRYPAHEYSGNRGGYSGEMSGRGNYGGGHSGEYSGQGSGNYSGYSNEHSGNYSNNYSGHSLRQHLEEAMMMAPDDRTREEIGRLMSRM